LTIAAKLKIDPPKANQKSSIFNLQFPDESGFTLRFNRLVRVGVLLIKNVLPFCLGPNKKK